MRVLKVVLLVLVVGALPLAAAGQQPTTLDQVVDRIVSREAALEDSLKPYRPLVETYIQNMRHDQNLGATPAGDKYFLGRAELSKGVELRSLTEKSGKGHRFFSGVSSFFSMNMQYLPRGFLQMIYLDMNGFNRQNYNFDYVRREFLGEVRCLVFDVTPLPKAGKGRFIGRIWIEDQDFTIVRFNGAYTGSTGSDFYFHFDSWRVNASPGVWLPAFIYSEESDLPYALGKHLQFKAQTRLWGYNLGHASQEQELSKVLVEAAQPIRDTSTTANDPSPVQAQRSWDRQAEDNVIDRLQRMGLLAPPGEVDKVLETVVNNLEVTNNLDIQPEVRCRVLLSSTFESFTIGHTIVLSRGLIDVLPDEAALATMVAHELGHVVLGHRIDPQYAFFDRLLFDDKETFQHFGFARPQNEETAANQKGMEMLKNSPYKEQLGNAGLFLQALESRAKDIPNLVSPHLGNRVPVIADLKSAVPSADPKDPKKVTQIAALPLGGRVKLDPWSDRVEMLKSKPVGMVAEREKMPFEVTPFMPYLTRVASNAQPQPAVTPETKAPNVLVREVAGSVPGGQEGRTLSGIVPEASRTGLAPTLQIQAPTGTPGETANRSTASQADSSRTIEEEGGYLGVSGTSEGNYGVKITQITANSPAARAGLRVGDIIEKLDSIPVRSAQILDAEIALRKPGSTMRVSYIRNSLQGELTVTVGKHVMP